MKSLVTGAAGFVGSSIADRLLGAGHEVVGIDCFIDYYPRELKDENTEAARANASYTFVEQSLVDCEIAPLLEGTDYVFHQAAQAGVRGSWGDEFRIYSDNNVYATQRLLESALESGVKKVVYASSSSVYGDTDDLPMREDSPTRPHSPYGVTKLAGEHLTSLYSRNFGLPTTALRYFTVYGPRQRPDMAFNRFIAAVLKNEEIQLYGDGEQSRDFTFVSDIVSANIAAALSDSSGDVFNIGGGSRTTVNEVIATIGEIIGREPRVNRLAVQKGDVKHTAADTSRAQAGIGFAPEVGIREGLSRQIEWQKERLDQ
jgi:UDP-glucose 4-epimerase